MLSVLLAQGTFSHLSEIPLLNQSRFYALEHQGRDDEVTAEHTLSAGNGWASKAQSLLSSDLSQITIERLMASALVWAVVAKLT